MELEEKSGFEAAGLEKNHNANIVQNFGTGKHGAENVTQDIFAATTREKAGHTIGYEGLPSKYEKPIITGQMGSMSGTASCDVGQHDNYRDAGTYLAKDAIIAENHKRCGMFEVKTAAGWLDSASKLPQPRMLFDCLWYDGEICYLFSDSNAGKTALAVQVANSIAAGTPIEGFRLETHPQPVLYVDFELSEVQFRNRYHDDAFGDFAFSENFFRLEVSRDADTVDFEDEVIDSLGSAVVEKHATVVVIDNLTYLLNDAQEAKNAASLMKRLKEFNANYNVSLLIIAHTPKRIVHSPLDQNSMAGSKMLLNFCDSCFAIGYGNTPKGRYLKQIKSRSSEIVYHAGNVALLTLDKYGCALSFHFEGYSTEDEQLFNGDDEARLIAQVKDLKSQGMSVRGIADKLGIDKNKVSRLMKK